MASGDSLLILTALHNEPPSANAATLDTRNQHPILDFDDSTDESAVFGAVLPRSYAGGGLTVTVVWMASTATTGDVIWNAQIERHQDDLFDLDADGFAAAQAVTAGAPSASGETSYDAVTFTDGAQMDSLAVGESFRLKVTRDADNASDNMTGDAELLRVEIRET